MNWKLILGLKNFHDKIIEPYKNEFYYLHLGTGKNRNTIELRDKNGKWINSYTFFTDSNNIEIYQFENKWPNDLKTNYKWINKTFNGLTILSNKNISRIFYKGELIFIKYNTTNIFKRILYIIIYGVRAHHI